MVLVGESVVIDAHFERFMAAYPRDYRSRCGVLRGVIPEVVDKFTRCASCR